MSNPYDYSAFTRPINGRVNEPSGNKLYAECGHKAKHRFDKGESIPAITLALCVEKFWLGTEGRWVIRHDQTKEQFVRKCAAMASMLRECFGLSQQETSYTKKQMDEVWVKPYDMVYDNGTEEKRERAPRVTNGPKNAPLRNGVEQCN